MTPKQAREALPDWAYPVDYRIAVEAFDELWAFLGDRDFEHTHELIRDICEIAQDRARLDTSRPDFGDPNGLYEILKDVKTALSANPAWNGQVYRSCQGGRNESKNELLELLQWHFDKSGKYERKRACPRCGNTELAVTCVAKVQSYSTGPVKPTAIQFDEGSACRCSQCGYAALLSDF